MQVSESVCGNIPENLIAIKEKAGTYLFSQVVSNQLSSAQQSLTSVFGMGTGGTSASSAPAKYASSLAFTYSLLPEGCTLKTEYYCELANGVPKDCGQALDLLVHASWVRHRTYTSCLSTL